MMASLFGALGGSANGMPGAPGTGQNQPGQQS